MTQSSQRVRAHTNGHNSEKVRREIENSVAYHAGHPDQIGRRLNDLESEWDIEQALQATSGSVSLFGMVWGTLFGRKWRILPLVSQYFLIQHAVQGWCPPVELFRRMGLRTRSEIDEERYALKALRGDFQDMPKAEQIPEGSHARRIIEAIES